MAKLEPTKAALVIKKANDLVVKSSNYDIIKSSYQDIAAYALACYIAELEERIQKLEERVWSLERLTDENI